jgi:EAL domain/CHASE4 domain
MICGVTLFILTLGVALAGMHVDVVLIVDRDGHEIFSCYSARSNTSVISPLPRAHLELLQLAADAPRVMRRPPAERIVATAQGLAAVSAVEITRSDGTDPSGATMLFARFIEDEDLERVRETSHLPVELTRLGPLVAFTLKIDYAFVRDLGKDTARTPIIHAVIDIAKNLNLSTVAEGVETVEQATLLLETGCDYAQSYYYSRPVTARHCRSLLEELRREKALTQTMLTRAMAS